MRLGTDGLSGEFALWLRELFPKESLPVENRPVSASRWMLQQLACGCLIKDKTIGVDSTTLEANVAMKSNHAPRQAAELHRVLATLQPLSLFLTPTGCQDLIRLDGISPH